MPPRLGATLFLSAVLWTAGVRAEPTHYVSFDQALGSAKRGAPDLGVARAREGVARSEVGVAGVYPNPSASVGTSTQAARLSVGVVVPLVLLGQRGSSIDAARAEQAVASADKAVVRSDVRQATAHAYTELWLAEHAARAQDELAKISRRVENSVKARVEAGTAPQMDALRARATRLRAEADAQASLSEVDARAAELARYMGVDGQARLRTKGAPGVREPAPPLASLLARVESAPALRRERADLGAAHARAQRERALARPGAFLGLGADMFDPTLPATNYRAELSVEVPLFNQRGAYVDRELAQAGVARARLGTTRAESVAELTSAYRRYQAATARKKSLGASVVPAAQEAASASEDAYTLGRAALVEVIDAERALIDARVSSLLAQAQQAEAWADVLHALGTE
jgi:outer membrane protein, heavy metal efflux system